MSTQSLTIEVGAGELLDKLSILRIKLDRIQEPAKRINVEYEERVLSAVRTKYLPEAPTLDALENELRRINEALWQIEDEIRACEAAKDFGPRFIELARSVYKQNDRRALVKKKINTYCGSNIVEEKSYTQTS
ncbi:MAG: hypothetical protein IK051_09040 [Rhodocyclaceae bacterium]|nr:hypothetical protein [Rhodocyclaceae bacterium]MBR4877663.1 hypothetical protein [Rhodocyclaceae bacterium]